MKTTDCDLHTYRGKACPACERDAFKAELAKAKAKGLDVLKENGSLRMLVQQLVGAYEGKLSAWEQECYAPRDLIARARAALT